MRPRRKKQVREGRKITTISIAVSREVVAEIDRLVDLGDWRSRSDFFEKTAREVIFGRGLSAGAAPSGMPASAR